MTVYDLHAVICHHGTAGGESRGGRDVVRVAFILYVCLGVFSLLWLLHVSVTNRWALHCLLPELSE